MDIDISMLKTNSMTPEEELAAIADMKAQDKILKKEEKDLKVGRALRSPVMNAINAVDPQSQEYDKERYTDEVLGSRDDDMKVLDSVRDTAYVGGTIAADLVAAKAISKLLGKLGLAPMLTDKREARLALKSKDPTKLKKALDINAEIFTSPENKRLSILGREAKTMKVLQKEMPASHDALVTLQRNVSPGKYKEATKARLILEQIADINQGAAKAAEGIADASAIGGRSAAKALEENETYRDYKDLNPNRKHGFISTIIDTLKTTQLLNNRDMIDIERVKREFPIERLNEVDQKTFNRLVEQGYDKELLDFVLRPEIRLQIKEGK